MLLLQDNQLLHRRAGTLSPPAPPVRQGPEGTKMLLQHSVRHQALSASPKAPQQPTFRHFLLETHVFTGHQSHRRLSCHVVAAAASEAASSEEPAAEQAPAAAQAVAEQLYDQDEQQQDVQQQVASSSIGLPPGPMEPPDEEPKKLSAAARLSEALASTSITILGDDTELNWAVCQALSKKIGWFPVSTRKVLCGIHKADSLQELIEREGWQAVVDAEAKMLKGMRDQLRCCISTIGDGAVADASLYPHLYGTILIWLDEEDKRSPKAASTTRELYQQQAEVRGKVAVRKGGFGEKPLSLEDKAVTVVSQLIKALLQLLKKEDTLLARKHAYIEMGCRGDWPQLQPPEWNPVVEGLDRNTVA